MTEYLYSFPGVFGRSKGNRFIHCFLKVTSFFGIVSIKKYLRNKINRIAIRGDMSIPIAGGAGVSWEEGRAFKSLSLAARPAYSQKGRGRMRA
jgi:hypothetical protein